MLLSCITIMDIARCCSGLYKNIFIRQMYKCQPHCKESRFNISAPCNAHELYGMHGADTRRRPGKQLLLARMWNWHDAEYLFGGYKTALWVCFVLECLITYGKGWRVYSNPKYRFSKWILLRIHKSLAFCLFTTDNDISLQVQFYYRKTNNTSNGTFVIVIIIISSQSSSCFYELGSPSCFSS
jgi:hypothetical protein